MPAAAANALNRMAKRMPSPYMRICAKARFSRDLGPPPLVRAARGDDGEVAAVAFAVLAVEILRSTTSAPASSASRAGGGEGGGSGGEC